MTLTMTRPVSAPVAEGVHALDLRHVTVRYPDGTDENGKPVFSTALDSATLQADAGTFTAVLGPSGSGKSTLLSVVAGLVVPTEGCVRIGGVALDGLDEDARTAVRRERVGIVFQQPNLLPSLTAREQLVVVKHLAGAGRREMRETTRRADELLELVGLGAQGDRRPHQLSGGQRQRVNVARALMSRPDVLLADEPTSALDHERSRAIVDLLTGVTRELGVATLMVTHDTEFADDADRVVTMRDGVLSV